MRKEIVFSSEPWSETSSFWLMMGRFDACPEKTASFILVRIFKWKLNLTAP